MSRKQISDISKTIINNIASLVNDDYNYVTTESTRRYCTSYIDKTITTVENRFTLPKEMFEAVDFTNMGVVEEAKEHIPTFIKGEKYALKGTSCEGFDMQEKVYELVGVHDTYDGVNINSLIVKQVSGEKDKIFTLSKNDCECMGIEYEKGLQLFPKQLNWRRVKDTIPFSSSNLATTPLSDIDNTIRFVLLKINGFKDYSDGYVLSPSGKLIKERKFEESLKIISNEPIVYSKPTNRSKGIRIPEGTPLKHSIVYPKGLTYNHGNFISSEDAIYVLISLVSLAEECENINSIDNSIDGYLGVNREYLEGFNPNDHFIISWDELAAYTVEEYETEKINREKARQERIAREEIKRKQRIAEEEKRIKERQRKRDEALERIKTLNLPQSSFPKFEKFKIGNDISSLKLYDDRLEVYFDGLEKNMTRLSNDLSTVFKTIGIDADKKTYSDKLINKLFDLI